MACPACDAPLGSAAGISLPWAGPDVKARSYHLCPDCDLVFLDPAKRPSAADARARYLLHENSLGEAGYRDMLEKFIDTAIAPYLHPPRAVLDYGSGPAPSMGALLGERGYSASSWDPEFSPEPDNRSGPFAAVIMHEVLEHCFSPANALRDAASMLPPGGILAVSTLSRPRNPEDFLRWWYREDITHVSFYSKECLSAICREAGFDLVWQEGESISVFRKRVAGPEWIGLQSRKARTAHGYR
jgi:SAM-dependent methyltransferase